RQRMFARVLRGKPAELNPLAVPAVGKWRGAGRRAQALIEEVITLARVGAAKAGCRKLLEAVIARIAALRLARGLRERNRPGRARIVERLERIDRRSRCARTGRGS